MPSPTRDEMLRLTANWAGPTILQCDSTETTGTRHPSEPHRWAPKENSNKDDNMRRVMRLRPTLNHSMFLIILTSKILDIV